MELVQKLYPEFYDDCKKSGSVYGPSDYQPMVEHFGKVAIQVDDNDYQGDSRVLYDNDGLIGWLQFGWGSCCGCDALQGCDTVKELEKLIVTTKESIKWFDSPTLALKFFLEHDWKGDYSWHQEEQKQFVEKAIGYLEQKYV